MKPLTAIIIYTCIVSFVGYMEGSLAILSPWTSDWQYLLISVLTKAAIWTTLIFFVWTS